MNTNTKGGADTSRFKMKPKPGSPPGIELDGHGNPIPFEQRTEDDKEAALAAGMQSARMANPEGDAPKATPTKKDRL